MDEIFQVVCMAQVFVAFCGGVLSSVPAGSVSQQECLVVWLLDGN